MLEVNSSICVRPSEERSSGLFQSLLRGLSPGSPRGAEGFGRCLVSFSLMIAYESVSL